MKKKQSPIVTFDNPANPGNAHIGECAKSTPQQILELTGEAVLLNVRSKTKAPTEKRWTGLRLGDMTDHYLDKLTSNIGVSLGAPSNGLHSIDCDDDKFFEDLGLHNPRFAETLQSRGARGGNYWIRIKGNYPKNRKIYLRDTKNPVGEWRSTGNQTIIYGTHPSGISYSNNGKRVITLKYEEINWPNAWDLSVKKEGIIKTPVEGASFESKKVPFEAVEAMLMSIPPTKDRDLWMKISAAVCVSLGDIDKSKELLKIWAPEWEKDEYDKLLEYPFSQIGFGTLVHHARDHGFKAVVSRFFYNGTSYAMRGSRFYIALNEGAVKQHITQLKVPKKDIANILCQIRVEQYVAYIGEVAGHAAGLHIYDSKQFLVTTGPNIISPSKSKKNFVQNIFFSLLSDANHPEQHICFLDWLSHCRRAVRNGRRVQSPALIMAGKRGDGKSLAIEIISRCLGGRKANGYRYLCGETPFNKEIAGSELIFIDDAASSRDPRFRSKLAQNIKGFLFNSSIPLEGKNKDSFGCAPVHAVVFAVNDDPEHLRVLPELDDSMRDKVILINTAATELPLSLNGKPELIKAEISKTLPAFLYELDSRDLSKSYDSRGRLKCFWHPAITEEIGLLSNEQRLLELIHLNFPVTESIKDKGFWLGTASELQLILTDRYNSNGSHSAQMLLNWNGSCGSYLAKLSKDPKSGVSRAGLSKTTRIQEYKIGRPG